MPETSLAGRHAIVTGGNGYIGTALSDWLCRRGCAVTVLARTRPRKMPRGADWLRWRIGEDVPDAAWRGGDLLFHLAHDWTADRASPERSENLKGTRRVLEAARRRGAARVIVASSQLARPDTASAYGRVKHAIERSLAGPGEIAVRMGFVYGGSWGGPAGRLAALVRRFPVVPLPGGRAAIRPVHIDDVCAARGALAVSGWQEPTPPFLAGERVALGRFVAALGTQRFGRRRRSLPVPPVIFALAARLVPDAVAPSLRDRLAGLGALADDAMVGPPHAPDGCSFRGLEEGLAGDRRRLERRAWLREASDLMSWIAGVPAPAGPVRKYARALATNGRRPLALPRGPAARRISIRWREIARPDRDTRDRLAFALELLERDPRGRAALGRRTWVRAAAGTVADMAIALVGKPGR